MRQFWNKIRDVLRRFLTIVGSPWFKIAILVISVVIAAVVFSSFYWCWLTDGESGSTTVRNLGLVVTALIGMPIAIWRSVVAHRQAETAQGSLLNERYQKGAEMLGSDDLPVRLGGIYALERLAREHPEDYHPQILRLFCSYVRNPPVAKAHGAKLPEDVQEVITAVCARSEAQIEIEKREYCPLDMSGSDLQGVNLFIATFRKLLPRGKTTRANLEGAIMDGANLKNACLTTANMKRANLGHVDLTGAFMIDTDLSSANLRNCKGLTQVQLDQAIASSGAPPNLGNVVDATTGKPLVWR